jgi:ketosteroid isomerase-like protein
MWLATGRVGYSSASSQFKAATPIRGPKFPHPGVGGSPRACCPVWMDVPENLERMLDKGIVVDAWARALPAGIDLAALDARVIIASLKMYLEYVNEAQALLRIVREAFDAWNGHDVERYTALLDVGYVGETYRDSSPLRGPEDARRALERHFSAFPDLHFVIEGVLAAGDDVLVSWVATRTRRRGAGDADAGAPPPRVPGCTVIRLQGRKIVHTWIYWDTPNWLQSTASALQ